MIDFVFRKKNSRDRHQRKRKMQKFLKLLKKKKWILLRHRLLVNGNLVETKLIIHDGREMMKKNFLHYCPVVVYQFTYFSHSIFLHNYKCFTLFLFLFIICILFWFTFRLLRIFVNLYLWLRFFHFTLTI